MAYRKPTDTRPTADGTSIEQSRNHSNDLMFANLAMAVIATICLAAMGNRIGLEIISGDGGRWGPGWEAGLAIATFTIFFAGVSALVCIARKQALSWIFTALAMAGLFRNGDCNRRFVSRDIGR